MAAARLLLGIAPAAIWGLDLSWTQYSDGADLPMSARWREEMRQQLLSMDAEALTPAQKMQRRQMLRRLGDFSGLTYPTAGTSAVGAGVLGWAGVCLGVCVLAGGGFLMRHFQSLSPTEAVSKAAAGRMANVARRRAAAEPALVGSSQPHNAPVEESVVDVLASVLKELGLESLSELGMQVVPCGKHSGSSFADILEDAAFCRWLRKEPRKGWMRSLKVYSEAMEGKDPERMRAG